MAFSQETGISTVGTAKIAPAYIDDDRLLAGVIVLAALLYAPNNHNQIF
jgi:hypothetical protein